MYLVIWWTEEDTGSFLSPQNIRLARKFVRLFLWHLTKTRMNFLANPIYNLNLILRKDKTNPNLGTVYKITTSTLQKCRGQDFPGGPVVKYPPSNAGDAGLIPGWGTKIPHAAGQLSTHATTTEPNSLQLESPHAVTIEPTCSGARAPQLERSPPATTKISHAATKTQCSQT